jgi:hypothetical protein
MSGFTPRIEDTLALSKLHEIFKILEIETKRLTDIVQNDNIRNKSEVE